MTIDKLATPIEAMREQMTALLKQIEENAKSFDLPALPTSLIEQKKQLIENRYKVLVVGEAKRGKSTFINALIGKNIVPTDIDIATSQVFHISNAPQPSFKIRYEDESTRSIDVSELGLYGSQVVIDEQGMTEIDDIIRWIEVEIPTQYLPDGVSILDTPGLGSLYSEHSQITKRFVPFADAVIYVLDSSQPLGQPDVEFISKILEITQDIFFVQTRIDQFRRSNWRTVQKRNQELLKEKFGDHLFSNDVWPISSTNLFKAIETGDHDYLRVSKSEAMLEALEKFLFRATGWNRLDKVLKLTKWYYQTAETKLRESLASLEDPSQDSNIKLLKLAEKRHQQFDESWGVRGAERQSLLLQIELTIRDQKRKIDEALGPEGEIAQTQLALINQFKIQDEFERFGMQLRDETIKLVMDKIHSSLIETTEELSTILGPFEFSVHLMNQPLNISQTSTNVGFALAQEGSLTELTNLAMNGYTIELSQLPADEIAKIGMTTFQKLASNPKVQQAVFVNALGMMPKEMSSKDKNLAFALVVVGSIATYLTVKFTVNWLKRKSRRDSLEELLRSILVEMRAVFLQINPETGKSYLDRHFDQIRQDGIDYLNNVSAQKLSESEAELSQFKSDASLSSTERAKRAKIIRDRLQEWQAVGKEIDRLEDDLTNAVSLGNKE